MGHDILDAGDFLRFGSDGLDGLIGLVQGRPFWQADAGHEVALVFRGHEGRRQDLIEQAHEAADDDQEDDGIAQVADAPADAVRIFLLDACKEAVEGSEEFPQRPLGNNGVTRLQDGSTEGRRQDEGDDGRNGDADGDGNGELLVQLAGDAAHEGDGDEDGR